MKITCNNCQEVIGNYLCDLPSEWRTQIAKVICDYINPSTPINCQDVKKCETLTTLSAFSYSGNDICIDYTDENGTTFHRCFSATNLKLNLDPKCIMSQESWDLLNFEQQVQAIIDFSCTCIGGDRVEIDYVQGTEVLICPYLSIYCDATLVFQSDKTTCNSGGAVHTLNTIQEQVDWLNMYYGSIGSFTNNSGTIVCMMRQEVIDNLCPSGTITFTVLDFD